MIGNWWTENSSTHTVGLWDTFPAPVGALISVYDGSPSLIKIVLRTYICVKTVLIPNIVIKDTTN